MLNFIGCGSAFNTKLGNNGAYIKKDNILFMIDCGSNTFDRLQNSNILDGIDEIIVLLTHTHPDHVGSLGDLIFYSYYSMGKIGEPNLIVFAPTDLRIKALLRLMGVDKNTYDLIEFDNVAGCNHEDNIFNIKFEAVKVDHVKELNCYGYIIYFENEVIYYSGDSNMIPNEILKKLHNDEFDKFYQDTCKADYDGNVHLSLRKLDKLIEPYVRDIVYCMHLDSGFDRREAIELGFNVVEINNEFL